MPEITAESQFNETMQRAKEAVEQAKTALLKTFAFIPDEKLFWSPSPTARTPVWMVAHCGTSNEAFATILRGDTLPFPDDPAQVAAIIRAGGQNVKSRAEAIEIVETSTAKVINALDKATPAMLESTPQSPVGPIPYTVWMQIPAQHMLAHTSQLEYLQTIWGDLETHS